MKTIKNLEEKDLDISFEGYTYHFPKGKIVFVEDNLVEHLKETVPLAFDFDIYLKKNEVVPKAGKTKTPVYVRPSPYEKGMGTTDMKITGAGAPPPTFGQGVDITPPAGAVDKDGVGWYGEGISVEQAGRKVFK